MKKMKSEIKETYLGGTILGQEELKQGPKDAKGTGAFKK